MPFITKRTIRKADTLKQMEITDSQAILRINEPARFEKIKCLKNSKTKVFPLGPDYFTFSQALTELDEGFF